MRVFTAEIFMNKDDILKNRKTETKWQTGQEVFDWWISSAH